MHVSAFLDELAATPRRWRVTEEGGIRLGRRMPRCPLLVIFGNWFVTARIEHRGRSYTAAIINAADGTNAHDPKIRAALLAACGLKGGTDV
jgi:hypothetical protein